jgi:hypothetical protein
MGKLREEHLPDIVFNYLYKGDPYTPMRDMVEDTRRLRARLQDVWDRYNLSNQQRAIIDQAMHTLDQQLVVFLRAVVPELRVLEKKRQQADRRDAAILRAEEREENRQLAREEHDNERK